MGTFSLVATRDPFAQSSEAHAISNIIASFLALAQVVHNLPKQAKARPSLWVFLLASLVPYLANVLAIGSTQSLARLSFSGSPERPIETLVDSAKVSFEILLQHQSKNYTAVYGWYRRRYRMEPPSGFEDWYNFTALHQWTC